MASPRHLAIVSLPGWGHLRPLLALSRKIVDQKPDVVVTILAAGEVIKKAHLELDRYFSGEQKLKDNIRVIGFVVETFDWYQLFAEYGVLIEPFYKSVLQQETISCVVTGKSYEPWPKPKVVLFDMYLNVFSTLKAVDPSVKLLTWSPGNTSATLRTCCPEEIGGNGDVSARARAELERSGGEQKKIEYKITFGTSGKVVQIPGLPPMFDYEFYPNEIMEMQHDLLLGLFTNGYRSLTGADGVIASGSIAYESEALLAYKDWCIRQGKEFYTVGPLALLNKESRSLSQSNANEKALSDKGSDIEAFLNQAFEKYGAHSVLYISFGTAWWPNPAHLHAFIGVPLELKVPFIFAHATPASALPPDLANKIQESGLGLTSTWAPQQLILNHKATGWFLTHCGQNSVVESLTYGIPLIAWPLAGDQPDNAARLSVILDVAYQVIEARTGEAGLKSLKRGAQPSGTVEALTREARQILKKAQGPDGAQKRKNAQAISSNLKRAWEVDGDAYNDLKQFLGKEFP
ncbi:glycosyltransferase family 1 protein [Sphaerobolus stellatus SS14]|uniref:Glycosyltransferase family 1 protein n=1 Tax=Sphaerobolus stellatus (strain SS14) TaxID=990650 RepID=A0A0C9UHN8_SPHS4|nr:glycosyltransferase family 1 protein [Sphaerobolus stellatus SS14]